MLFYRFNRDPDDYDSCWLYTETFAALRPIVRMSALHSVQPTVEAVEVPTDKAYVAKLLNEAGPSVTVRRAWKVTPRGALRPMTEAEFAEYMSTAYA